MNLARGSGLRGLGGIRPVRENIIRPLLNTRRSEIEAALRGRQITWRTDETNRQTEYTRNRIRLEILPLLAQGVNGQAASHIAQAGLRLQEQRIISRARCRNLQSVTYIMRKKRSQKYFLSEKDSAVRSI